MAAEDTASATDADDLRERVAAHPLWYHTLELGPGWITPGWFDLRSIVDRIPWPDVRGKRCLDVGTYDGFLAFELERRGAAEVIATDIADHLSWDWTPRERVQGPAYLDFLAGPHKHRGFELAREALGSTVKHEVCSVYDLNPERLGRFDVVVCGALLIHLRDPQRALEAIRSVCEGRFLSVEEISLPLTMLHPRKPMAELRPRAIQWSKPNLAGLRQMLTDAGFDIERESKPYATPFGPGHPVRSARRSDHTARLARRLALRGDGVPFVAMLTHPAV